jgi:hypothetical protein
MWRTAAFTTAQHAREDVFVIALSSRSGALSLASAEPEIDVVRPEDELRALQHGGRSPVGTGEPVAPVARRPEPRAPAKAIDRQPSGNGDPTC